MIGFDETYRHQVYNHTQQYRLILFMDVERVMNTQISQFLNRSFIKTIAPLTTRKNEEIEMRHQRHGGHVQSQP